MTTLNVNNFTCLKNCSVDTDGTSNTLVPFKWTFTTDDNSTGLDDFDILNSGSASYIDLTTNPGWLSIKCNTVNSKYDNGLAPQVRTKDLLLEGGLFDTVCYQDSNANAPWEGAGLFNIWSDGGDLNRYLVFVALSEGNPVVTENLYLWTYSGSSNSLKFVECIPSYMMMSKYSATNLKCKYSLDGSSYTDVGSKSLSAYYAMKIGVHARGGNTSGTLEAKFNLLQFSPVSWGSTSVWYAYAKCQAGNSGTSTARYIDAGSAQAIDWSTLTADHSDWVVPYFDIRESDDLETWTTWQNDLHLAQVQAKSNSGKRYAQVRVRLTPASTTLDTTDTSMWFTGFDVDTYYVLYVNSPDVTTDSLTTDPTPTWSWTSGGGADANGNFRYQLDSEAGSWTEVDTDTDWTPSEDLSHGSHTLYVQEEATDLVTWSESGSSTTIIDLVAPGAPVVSSEEAVTYDKTPTWSWTAGGGGNGTFRHQLYSQSGTWTETTDTDWTPPSDLSFATHVLYVQERDDAGNWSESGSYAVLIDEEMPLAPVISIAGVNDYDLTPTMTLQSAGGSGSGTFRWSKDETNWNVTTSEETIINLDYAGSYIIYAQESNVTGDWSDSSWALYEAHLRETLVLVNTYYDEGQKLGTLAGGGETPDAPVLYVDADGTDVTYRVSGSEDLTINQVFVRTYEGVYSDTPVATIEADGTDIVETEDGKYFAYCTSKFTDGPEIVNSNGPVFFQVYTGTTPLSRILEAMAAAIDSQMYELTGYDGYVTADTSPTPYVDKLMVPKIMLFANEDQPVPEGVGVDDMTYRILCVICLPPEVGSDDERFKIRRDLQKLFLNTYLAHYTDAYVTDVSLNVTYDIQHLFEKRDWISPVEVTVNIAE